MKHTYSRLLRQEAVDARSQTYLCAADIVVPPAFSVLAAFWGGIAAALVCLLCFGMHSPKDTVPGYVTTTEGELRVYPSSSGTVVELYVKDGDEVAEGDELARLATSRAAAQSAATRQAIVAALERERLALSRQVEAEKRLFVLGAARLEAEVAALERRLGLMQAQGRALLEAEVLAGRELERMSSPGVIDYVAERDRELAMARAAEVRIRMGALAVDADHVLADLRKARDALAEMPSARARRMAELDAEFQRVSARVAEAAGLEWQPVLAPRAGLVTGLLVKLGDTVSSDTVLLRIVPRDGRYLAELLVPPRTVGFVRAGAPVRIRYDTFPYQKFGSFQGRVVQLSRTVVMPGDKLFPLPVREPVYVAAVDLYAASLVAGEPLPLRAGMTLVADIEREERRLIEWLFEPLLAAASRL